MAALKFDSGGVMEYLWSQIDKTPEGNIRYSLTEVDTLWWMGFVDTQKHSLEEWREVFDAYRQPDGAYLLNKAAFLALDAYRYTGEIKVPFDPAMINEGKYTDEGLAELFELSVAPSCSLSAEELKDYLEKFKAAHREPDGLIKMAKDGKAEIQQLLQRSPSPLRNLELTLDQMIEDGVDEEMAQQLKTNETARVTSEVAKQVSQFSSMPGSRSEVEAQRLSALQQPKPARKPAASAEKKKTGTELKRIRRSRKGMRG